MKFNHKGRAILASILFLWLTAIVHGGTATTVYGVYYTGVSSGYALLNGGAQDSLWTVTYASTNGGSSANTT